MIKGTFDYIFSKKHSPRWFIFLIDLFICLTSILIAYLLSYNFEYALFTEDIIFFIIPFVLIVRSISFIITRIYAGIIRYTSTKDAARIINVVLLGSSLFIVANLLNTYVFNHKILIPFSIIGIDFFVTSLFMLGFRLLTKSVFLSLVSDSNRRKEVIIYGADDYGMAAKATLSGNAEANYKITAYIDDEKSAAKIKIDGITIHDVSELPKLIEKNKVSLLIFAKKDIAPAVKKDIIETCLHYDIKAQSVPDVNDWINGELSFNQLRRIKIEDLLERPPIDLNTKKIQQEICDNTLLITGAAGSIGSEIVRQVIRFHPRKVVIFDQAESPLYDLELELDEKLKKATNIKIIIGSVTNKDRLEQVFINEQPNIVFHAAAYKHVPMMENHPTEAIYTNVLGTKNVADLSLQYHVDKFVMISTDKAVNPTNVMGASKRIAEIYTQSLNKPNGTKFITTRFGNVLGSNGSVIPRFRKQIQEGGPVTVTHPDITRYFMTIPEACQLVLEAGTMGEGGEIFIFDMGKSVKIIDLAKKMIKLYGLTLGKDIEISFTGLRPGEKLYEELLNSKENTLPTHHSQIMIAKVRKTEFDTISSNISILRKKIEEGDIYGLVKQMKHIVPEYISKNSVYEKLDQ